mmetsp:Transcript_29337/g.73659  ORF Transcript_29337/g.73659 Transcript_29337/m.73659 type:complete len:682 (-) Transcript_29337:410-2455(-)
MGFHSHAVDIALSQVLNHCDGSMLCIVPSVSRSWKIIFCCLNSAHQTLFRDVCLQRWPWLRNSLVWSHCGHHLWHHYLGNWQALCCDGNRANAAFSLELVVPLDWDHQVRPCVQGPWTHFPGRDLQLRINVYPVGNRRMTTTHLSAYLEVLAPMQKREWHTALDFTFVMRHPSLAVPEVSWSSGPVRFVEHPTGGGRLDWGCHELLPLEVTSVPSGDVTITAHVALQEALIEVVHIGQLSDHVDDFGLSVFHTFEPLPRVARGCGLVWPLRICLPASATKAELLAVVTRALGAPVERLWRFSRSLEAQGRLACSLPEAPRHLLIDKSSAPVGAEEDGPSGVYALLTKWTLGESSGGARQNFFRLLAEGAGRDAITPLAYIGVSSTVRVFIKVFSPSHGLRFEAVVQVPNTENVLILLPPILAALGLPPTPPTPEAGAGDVVDEWCLAWEGSPSDWYRAPLGCSDEEMYSGNGGIPPQQQQEQPQQQRRRRRQRREQQLVNGHGAVVQGDTLSLCARSGLAELAKTYQRQYFRRVADFVALHARETRQAGSASFAELCQVMDGLNVDAWRLEQLLGSSGPGGGCQAADAPAAVTAAVSPRPLLCLLQSLPGLHPQFFCDACGTRELRGCRYNCLVCSDFDLCETCYRTQPEVLRPKDHNGRYHEKSHRMTRAWPALPSACLD